MKPTKPTHAPALALLALALIALAPVALPATAQTPNYQDGTFGPYLQYATHDGMVVCWRTGQSATSEVEYGPTTAYGSTIQNPQAEIVHQVAITGLSPNTRYHYRATSRIGTQVVFQETGSFRTAVQGATPFKYVAMAETHDRDEVALFAEEIAAADPHVILDASDHVDEGSVLSEWDEYFTIGKPFYKDVGVYGAVGNHLYLETGWFGIGIFGDIDLYKDLAVNPGNEEWYSVRYGDSLFLFVNSNWYYDPWRLSTTQIDWVEKTLQEATDGTDDPTWIVAVHHLPIWSSGPIHREFLDRMWMRHFLLKRYHKYGVDLALTSHDAHNEHSIDEAGFHELQTTCGKLRTSFRTRNSRSHWRHNGGRTIGVLAVNGGTLSADVVDDQGAVLHSFQLTKP